MHLCFVVEHVNHVFKCLRLFFSEQPSLAAMISGLKVDHWVKHMGKFQSCITSSVLESGFSQRFAFANANYFVFNQALLCLGSRTKVTIIFCMVLCNDCTWKKTILHSYSLVFLFAHSCSGRGGSNEGDFWCYCIATSSFL